MAEFIFQDGCMWEGDKWKIVIDEECAEMCIGNPAPCKHCYNDHIERISRYDGSTYTKRVWTCPSVIVGKNEGGCNSVGICLQCVLDAAETIKDGNS